MKFIIFFNVLTLVLQYSYAQNIDSLLKIADSSQNKKSAEIFMTVSDFYLYSNPDSALFFLDKALTKVNGDDVFLKKLKAGILQKKAIIKNEQGNIDTALIFLKESLKIAEKIKDTSLIIKAKGNIGNSYLNISKYDDAISYYTDVIKLAEKRKNNKISAAVNGAMGNLYLAINDYEKALFYYQKSYEYFKELGSETGIALSNMNMATVYSNMKKYSKATENYKKANAVFIKQKNYLNSAKCKSGLAKIFFKTKDYSNSVRNEKEALKVYKLYDAVMDISYSYNLIADNYIHMKEYYTAILYLDSAFNIQKKGKNLFKVEQITDKLRICYDSLKDYKKAYKYSLLHKAYYDSVFNEKSDKRFSELEVKFETAQKEQQLELYKKNEEILKEESRIRFIILISLIILFAVSVLLFLLVLSRQKLRANIKESELENKLLRVQMNPHFIFNALSSIEFFMYKNDFEKSALYIADFAKLMRLILESSRKNFISLKQDIEILNYYVKFQNLRLDYPVNLKIKIFENADTENILIPPMLIQPFIENSFKHGFSKNTKDAEISLSFVSENNFIFVEIEDNGAGYRHTQKNNDEHLSLSAEITKERLLLLFGKKKYKDNILNITDLKDIYPRLSGTRVTFKIPYIEEF